MHACRFVWLAIHGIYRWQYKGGCGALVTSHSLGWVPGEPAHVLAGGALPGHVGDRGRLEPKLHWCLLLCRHACRHAQHSHQTLGRLQQTHHGWVRLTARGAGWRAWAVCLYLQVRLALAHNHAVHAAQLVKQPDTTCLRWARHGARWLASVLQWQTGRVEGCECECVCGWLVLAADPPVCVLGKCVRSYS